MERTCKKCGETKPIEEFYKNKKSKFGYLHICKLCSHIHAVEYHITYKERINNNRKEWYKNNKEHSKKYCREYRENNKEHCKEHDREYRENNKEHLNELSKKYIRGYRKNNIIPISDKYIIEQLRVRFGISRQVSRQYPELIENYRQQIKLKRLIKTKKDENTKTG
jgi:hypothetical protein